MKNIVILISFIALTVTAQNLGFLKVPGTASVDSLIVTNSVQFNTAKISRTVSTLSALESLSVPDGTLVGLQGYYAAGDMPSVLYTFVAGDTSTVDNGSVVTNAAGRFKLQPQGGRVDIRTFGAIGDWLEIGAVWTNTSGVTNITLASAPATNYVGKKIALRRGNTSVGAEVTVTLAGDAVSSFTVVSNGQGYINIPTNVLVSGPGSGATTTCVLTNGRLSSITVGAGGSGYSSASVFKIRSTDCGTTNAPYYTELFSVSNQVGTTIGLSSTPTFSEPLNPYDEVGAAALYTDNQVAIQAAVDYAAAHGLEVYIPQGDFGTGPVYLNAGQKIVGGGIELARLHSAALIGYSLWRKSVLAPKNVNPSNGRQLVDDVFGPADIGGFTIDGSSPYQSPMGISLNQGSFANFGINCAAVQNWTIHDMLITNCQGGAVYYGSWTPSAGLSGNWAGCQSKDILVRNCLFVGNWRQAHQLGNVTRLLEEDCRIIDSSLGYYSTAIARSIAQGFSVGQNATYSPEQIDAEANSGARAGHNKFINCWMQNKYGKAVDLFFDQEYTDFIDCTFQDNLLGSITSTAASISSPLLNQDGGAEWSTIRGCHFFATSTNFASHLSIKSRAIKVIDNIFSGKTGSTTQGFQDVSIDGSGYSAAPEYVMYGNIVRGNTFNLYPTDGTLYEGAIKVVGTTTSNIKNFRWDNTVIAGTVDIRTGTDDNTVGFSRMSGVNAAEGYAYQSAVGGNPNYASEASTAGFGSQDWTFMFRYLLNPSSQKTGEMLRWIGTGFVELKLTDRMGTVSNCFQLDWNPNNTGNRTIQVPSSAGVREAFSATLQYQRPINLAITKTHGSVYKVVVTSGGSGYTNVPTVSFGGGAAAATAQIDSTAGTVTNIYITARGSSYTTNPVVTLTGGTAGSVATATASVGKIDFYLDDLLIYTDYGTDIITSMTTAPCTSRLNLASGTAARAMYAYGIWNRPLAEDELRQAYTLGPLQADRWGTPGSTLGCISYIKFNPGVGYFFEDMATQKMNLWCGQDITHGVPKRTGQLLKTLAVTSATGATNSFNIAIAASPVIPANARITSAYVIPKSGAAPTIRIGFDSAITDQLVAPVTLTASTTNYLSLVPSMVYGTTNRPVYIGQTGAATNEITINYSLDQGALDGSAIQSGIVTAPGGLGSTSAIAPVPIDATGWTNVLGVNAMVYAEGTGLQYTIYNAAGTPVYTNAATVGSASIAIQKGGKVIVVAGTGVTGWATPW